jgi:tape measure domain-containing protein
MPEIDRISLLLFVDDSQARAALSRYERVSDRAFKQVESRAGGAERAIGRLNGVLAGVSAAALAKSFLDIADVAKTLDAQLKLATAGFGSFAQAQDDVRKIAAVTRSGLEETASLYGSFARSANELGLSQGQVARATQTVSEAYKISGASAVDAAQGTRQLIQAFQSGVLRGDEFNSIMESSPRLARLLADSLGIPIGQLRAMAEAGQLTADKLSRAFTDTKFTDGIDAEFRQLPVTFDQAMTQVSNAAIITFGAFDRGGQFSTALSNFVTDGSDGFKGLEQSAINFGITARSEIEGLASAFAPVVEAGQHLFDVLGSGFRGIDLSRDIDKSLGQIDKLTANLAGNEGLFEQYINTRLYGKPATGTTFQADRRRTQQAAETRLRRENGQTPVSRRLAALSEAGRNAGLAGMRLTLAIKPAGARKKTGSANSAEAAAKRAERENEKAIRDEASKARESAQLQDDINAAKAALAVAANDVLSFNLTQIDSERDQRIAEYQTQADLGRLSKEELKNRKASVEEIAELQRQRVHQIADEANRRDDLDLARATNQNQQDLYRAEAGLIDARENRYAIELRLVDLAYEQERNDLEAVKASRLALLGDKAYADAAFKAAEARLAILPQLQDADQRAVDRQYESPLDQRRREVRETAATMNDSLGNIELDALDRLTDGLADASTQYIKLGGVAGSVINGIIRDLVKLAAQQAIFGKGGGGGFFGSIGKLFGLAGAAGAGGVTAGSDITVTRGGGFGFARGGYTGAGGRDEVAGIVHRGEYVVPADAVSRIGVQNLAALTNTGAAAAMTGVTAAGAGGRTTQQTVVVQVQANDYFDAKVKQEATRVAVPVGMAASESARQGAGSDAARAARRRIPGR